jgi:hypothetical protein
MSTTSSGVRVRRRPWRLPSLSLAAVVLLAHVAGLWGKPCGEANPPTSTLWWLTLRVTSGTSVRMSIPVVVVVVHLHLPSHRQAQDRNVSRASHASPSQIRCAREMKSDRGCTARYNTPHTRTRTHTHTNTGNVRCTNTPRGGRTTDYPKLAGSWDRLTHFSGGHISSLGD